MLRRIYDWTLNLAANKNALLLLAIVSFLESSIFPIPPDVMLIPMILAARNRAWLIAGVCTTASVLGGIAGYGIGALFFDLVGTPILNFYNYDAKFEEFQKRASDNYDAIKYSRLVYSGENKSENGVNVDFMIKIDDREIDLFDMQISDPYREEETAKFIFDNERWVLDKLIWPVDWCEEIK